MRIVVSTLAAAVVVLGGVPDAAVAQRDPGLVRLEQELTRLAAAAGGVVGVGVVHFETGREVYVSRGERFPMASTYKVPIAVQLLTRVDRGEVRLDSMIALEPGDLHPGSGTLTELFDDPGVILSVRNLLELMLLISDNSATDLVLRTAGGADAVTARMRALGVDGITVNRPTRDLIFDWVGIREAPPPEELRPSMFRALFQSVPEDERKRAAQDFDVDPRDTATPEGMAALLTRLWRRQILSDTSTALLLDIMTRSTTGTSRLKGMLPSETPVAHKTGTIGGTTNDVGIITLPGEAGHVVTVVFVKASTKEVAEREKVIAHLARAVHDYFLFNPGSAQPPRRER